MAQDLFQNLVEEVALTLSQTIDRIKNSLETNRRLEKEFEHQVLIAFKASGRKQGFECTASSEHGFPDIVCLHKASGLKFGVEVKTGRTCKINGNSIFTEIGEMELEDLVVLFCKTSEPIKIFWKRYEDAVSGVAITHSPRYTIDMDIDDNSTFFKKMDTTYKGFKKMSMEEKMGLVKKHYLLKQKKYKEWWML